MKNELSLIDREWFVKCVSSMRGQRQGSVNDKRGGVIQENFALMIDSSSVNKCGQSTQVGGEAGLDPDFYPQLSDLQKDHQRSTEWSLDPVFFFLPKIIDPKFIEQLIVQH